MIKYYTYKIQVPLKPGEKLSFKKGFGYFAKKAASLPPRNLSQYVVFCAQEAEKALHSPPKYKIAVSADKAYRDGTLAVLPELKKVHGVPGWCDCRPAPDGTPASVGAAFVKEYGLAYFIGQAENAAQFDDAMSVGARCVIGNITSLRQDQIDKMQKDGIEFIQEDYWNEGWGRAQHPAISAYCAGIYPTALWNPQIYNYRQAGRWREGDGLYYAATVEDWENLP